MTSLAFPASGYGVGCPTPNATTCPAVVLTSTASMTSTPEWYAGASGGRVPSPWSVSTTNDRPACRAAAAISSTVPVPSERLVWM